MRPQYQNSILSTVGLIECLFVFVSTYKPIVMITEPSQFSLIPRFFPSYSVAYVTVQLKRWRIDPGNEAIKVSHLYHDGYNNVLVLSERPTD